MDFPALSVKTSLQPTSFKLVPRSSQGLNQSNMAAVSIPVSATLVTINPWRHAQTVKNPASVNATHVETLALDDNFSTYH